MSAVRILPAVGLGALLGSIAGAYASEFVGFGAMVSVPVGALVGACVGWLTYDIRAVGRALLRAGNEVGDGIVRIISSFVRAIPAILIVVAWCAAVVVVNALCWNVLDEWSKSASWFHIGIGAPSMDTWWYVKMCCASLFTVAAVAALDEGDGSGPQILSEVEHQFGGAAAAAVLLVVANPAFILLALACLVLVFVCVCVVGLYTVVRYLCTQVVYGAALTVRAIVALPWFVMTCGRVMKRAFIYVHSDARLICFLNGGLGGGVGAYFGDAPFGAIVGIVGALVQYAIAQRLRPRPRRLG